MQVSNNHTLGTDAQQPVVLMPCVSMHFLSAIKAVQDLGGYVITVDHNPNAACHKLADEGYAISATDLDTILALAQEHGVTRAIATSETSVRVVAYVTEKMQLPQEISFEDAYCATHKDAMRNRFAEHGVPIPQYTICRDFETFEKAVKSYDFYCVIKPSDNASSRGVKLLDSSYDSIDLRALYEETRGFSTESVVLVEERVDGPEVSVESITLDGETTVITITDKLTTPPPYCAEMGHTEPSRLPAQVQEEIIQATKLAVSALGLKNGPSHTEVKVGPRGARVIETGVRPGGDFITGKLVPLSTGFDFLGAAAAIGMGVKPAIEKPIDKGAAIRFISAPSAGVIASINVDDRLNAIDGLKEFELYLNVGDAVKPSLSNNDHVGHVLCVCDTAEEAARQADEALGCIEVCVNQM